MQLCQKDEAVSGHVTCLFLNILVNFFLSVTGLRSLLRPWDKSQTPETTKGESIMDTDRRMGKILKNERTRGGRIYVTEI